jgi:phage recombination protein Bet
MTHAEEAPLALTVLRRPEESLAAQLHEPSKQAILRQTITTDLSQPEFDLFLEVCVATGLNPFMRQIHAIKRGSGNKAKMTIQTGIDGYRLLAQRTGQLDGQDGPYWCGDDGIWRDVWLSAEPPVAAKVTVYRKDMSRGFSGIARFEEYAQYTNAWENGQNTGRQVLNSMWGKMPAGQIAKCAEALALRKAFPAEMSGIYTEDEMAQADSHEPEPPRSERPKPAWFEPLKAALSKSPFTMADLRDFFATDDRNLARKITEWLYTQPPTTELMLVKQVGDWRAAGSPERRPSRVAVEPEPAPSTDPETFDEAEWRDPSEPTSEPMFDMPEAS